MRAAVASATPCGQALGLNSLAAGRAVADAADDLQREGGFIVFITEALQDGGGCSASGGNGAGGDFVSRVRLSRRRATATIGRSDVAAGIGEGEEGRANMSNAHARPNPPLAPSANEKEAVHEVLRGYYEAFGRDAVAAAAFFGEPTLIVTPTEFIVIKTRAELASYLDRFAAGLKANGFSHSKFSDLRITLLNPATALCGLIAIRMKSDGTELQRAGFTYLLHKSSAGWRIYEFIPTEPDKLISGD
jgi:hypothetical protein